MHRDRTRSRKKPVLPNLSRSAHMTTTFKQRQLGMNVRQEEEGIDFSAVVVNFVMPGMTAAQQGVKVGDRLSKLNGKTLEDLGIRNRGRCGDGCCRRRRRCCCSSVAVAPAVVAAVGSVLSRRR